MKKKIVVAGLLATVLASQGAQAKTLEDILKEKGVITEEDYKEVVKSAPLQYKVGDGFTFQSADEKFKLSVGGQVQARYTFTDKDGAAQDTSEWRIRRVKTWFKGNAFTKDLEYKLQLNFGEQNGTSLSTKVLEECYLNYRLIDEAQIRMGQDKVPFARQELVSTAAQQFVDRANATDTFKPGYDTGAMLNGKFGKGLVEYAFGWFGGNGQANWNSSNNENAIAARIEVNPFGYLKKSEADLEQTEKPLLSVGADYYRNVFVKAATNNTTFFDKGWLNKGGLFAANEKIEVNTASADVAFKWLGASLQGEYFWAQGDGNSAARTTQRAQGFYAQAGYFVIPQHLELAARYSYVDPNRDVANDLHTETQGAVSYYFNKHNLKLQGDISSIHQQLAGKPATDDMQYRLQAQIVF